MKVRIKGNRRKDTLNQSANCSIRGTGGGGYRVFLDFRIEGGYIKEFFPLVDNLNVPQKGCSNLEHPKEFGRRFIVFFH